jgi:hypothetical protein
MVEQFQPRAEIFPQLTFMRNSIILLLKCWLIGMLPVAASAQNANVVIDPVIHPDALQNFKLLLTFPTNTFTDRESIMYEAGLTNISDYPTIVLGSYFNENFWFYITNANGVRIPPIDDEYFWPGARGGREVVPPHGTERIFHPTPLNWYYVLAPGTYRIYAVREVGNVVNSIMYTSQPVTITIVESKASTATNTPPSKK